MKTKETLSLIIWNEWDKTKVHPVQALANTADLACLLHKKFCGNYIYKKKKIAKKISEENDSLEEIIEDWNDE